MYIKVHGSKGTIPFFNQNRIAFGCNTTCFQIDTCGETIILDCGTGVVQFYFNILEQIKNNDEYNFKMDILLGHLHLDHIMGFSALFPLLSQKNDICIYTNSKNESSLAEQIFGPFKPPYWPINLAAHNKAKLIQINDNEPFMLRDKIKIIPFKAMHQDGTLSFRIEGDKTLVYLLDYEISANDDSFDMLVNYCKDVDIVILDASFLPEDYMFRKGWGHSTYEMGIMLSEKSGCKCMIFAHLSYEYSDDKLNLLKNKIEKKSGNYLLAFDGMEIYV